MDFYAPFEESKHAVLAGLLSGMGPFELPLSEHVQRDWKTLSSDLDENTREALIGSIFDTDDRHVRGSAWIKPQFSADRVSFRDMWQNLAHHLKVARRYVLDRRSNSELEEAQHLVQHAAAYISRKIPSGTEYFRARKGFVDGERVQDILAGGQRPYEGDEIGAPPKSATLGGGRINPPGFSFLYLASDRDTAVAEVRPAKSEIVSAAAFKTTSDLTVADLTAVPNLDSPFEPGDLLRDVESRNLMKALSYEFAEPVSPEVGPLEYVPSQYATELLRDVGFTGIVYYSALGEGKNLVLFDPTNAKWGSSQLVKVDVRYSVTPTQVEFFRSLLQTTGDD